MFLLEIMIRHSTSIFCDNVGYYCCFCPSGVPLLAVCKNNSNIVTTLSHGGRDNTSNFTQTSHIGIGKVPAINPREKYSGKITFWKKIFKKYFKIFLPKS